MKNAIDTLKMIRDGLLLDEVGDELANLTRQVRDTGRPGKLVITLTVSPLKRGQGEIVTIADEVKTKVPSVERPSTVLFADEAGHLSANDPRQPKLPTLAPAVEPFRPRTGTNGAIDAPERK